MRKRLLFIIFVLTYGVIISFSVESCKHTPSAPIIIDTTGKGSNDTTSKGGHDTTVTGLKHPCSPDSVYFQNNILPLITSNCSMTGCHAASGNNGDAKSLTTYSEILRYVDSTSPKQSPIYTVLFSRDDNKMPPPPRIALTSYQDSLILTWLKQGALNNKCDASCDTTNVTYKSTILPILTNSCVGCHTGSAPSGKVLLVSYADVLAQVQNQNLLNSVQYIGGIAGMPISSKLSECDIRSIKLWIRDGAMNN